MGDISQTAGAPPRRRWLWLLVSLVVFFGVIFVLYETEDTADVTEVAEPRPAALASVIEVAAADARAQVSVFAELRPRWDAEIRAAVSGRVVAVEDNALAGTRVAAGARLFAIERTQYEARVAAAEVALEEARLALLRAENQVTVARQQFQRDGVEPPNDLALNLPQLRIAERSLASAEAELNAARLQLDLTTVTAPFSGFVTVRSASLGQTVSVGESLVHLSDDSQFELVVELSQDEWALLEHPIAGGQARLFHRDGRELGIAHVRQGGGFLDPETRQVRVFLDVPEPGEGILSGDFLRVVLTGRNISDSLTIPESALTRAGYVWFVGEDDLLQRTEPEILFRSGDTIAIAAPDGGGPWRVVETPLASFLPGQRVTPQRAED